MRFDIRNLDRRVVYLFVLLVVSLPIVTGYALKPSRLIAAEKFYQLVEDLKPGANDVVFVALDFGPNTKAENESQAEVVVEHLFRRRIHTAFFSQYAQAEGYLATLPQRVAERLNKEMPDQTWEYGKDWVNLGYRAGASLFVQALAKSESIPEFLGKDALGNRLSDMPVIASVKGLENVLLLAQFTGLTGVFDSYVQFFQKQNVVPKIAHGCTSITIPEAYIYLDSGQLKGLLEGVAGAAWYSELLKEKFPKRRPDGAMLINTAVGVGHLVIIFLIIFGNAAALLTRRRRA